MAAIDDVQGGPAFRLLVDGFDDEHFRVRSLRGREGMSDVYSFEVVVTGIDGGSSVEQDALGRRSSLIFEVGQAERAFYGVIGAVKLIGIEPESGVARYEMRLVPRLWLLKRKRRSRVFQGMRVPDIVASVLSQAGIGSRFQLLHDYPVREYCTQFEETDFRFIHRILAEAGIFYYFAQGPALDGGAAALSSLLSAADSAATTGVSATLGAAVGGVVGSAISAATPLVPGDTVVFADDSAWYPPIGKDDAAELAAASAAAVAPELVARVGGGLGGSALGDAVAGAASAAVGAAIAAIASKAAPPLRFLQMHQTHTSETDKVTRFELRNSVRSNAATYRDYDPERPLVPLSSTTVSSAPFPMSPLEMAASVAAAAANVVTSAANALLPGAVSSVVDRVAGDVTSAVDALANLSEVYDHHGTYLFPKWEVAADEAPKLLRQKRRRASIAEGDSGCPDLGAGRRFRLTDHPASRLDAEYVVVAVVHHGNPSSSGSGDWVVYRNELECAPVSMTFIPPRPKRKSVQVSLSAVVVGPLGEEIWVDSKGRIKVQFQWDRQGNFDDSSSCWIRAMQPWAGAAWGTQFVPRVGMEVLVSFLGGDPDCPVVIGSLYNATHPVPFILPQDKTRSGVRTQSTPSDRGGFNELSFEDRAGHEEIHLRAQRNLRTHTLHDSVLTVEHDDEATVHHDKSLTVGGQYSATIAGPTHLRHEGGRHSRVREEDSTVVTGERSVEITGSDQIAVGGAAKRRAAGDVEERAGGVYTIRAESGLSAVVGQGATPAQASVSSTGTLLLSAEQQVEISSSTLLTLRVGSTVLELSPDGIAMKGGTIKIIGTSGVDLSGGGPSISLGGHAQILADELTIYTKNASLQLDDNATLKGKAVQLQKPGSGPTSTSADSKAETQHLKLKLSDPNFTPLASKPFEVRADGVKVTGTTGSDGVLEADLPKAAQLAEITVWPAAYPTGPTWQITTRLRDLPAVSSIPGIRARLKNLGYFTGPTDVEVLDDALRRALVEFQRDHQLPESGEPDAATGQALSTRHGS